MLQLIHQKILGLKRASRKENIKNQKKRGVKNRHMTVYIRLNVRIFSHKTPNFEKNEKM